MDKSKIAPAILFCSIGANTIEKAGSMILDRIEGRVLDDQYDHNDLNDLNSDDSSLDKQAQIGPIASFVNLLTGAATGAVPFFLNTAPLYLFGGSALIGGIKHFWERDMVQKERLEKNRENRLKKDFYDLLKNEDLEEDEEII